MDRIGEAVFGQARLRRSRMRRVMPTTVETAPARAAASSAAASGSETDNPRKEKPARAGLGAMKMIRRRSTANAALMLIQARVEPDRGTFRGAGAARASRRGDAPSRGPVSRTCSETGGLASEAC